MTTTQTPAIGAHVTVIEDRYGTRLGLTGTVVPTPDAIALVKSVDLTGTVWVRPDGWAAECNLVEPGFDAHTLTELPVMWRITWHYRHGGDMTDPTLRTWAEVEAEMQADDDGRTTWYEPVVQG